MCRNGNFSRSATKKSREFFLIVDEYFPGGQLTGEKEKSLANFLQEAVGLWEGCDEEYVEDIARSRDKGYDYALGLETLRSKAWRSLVLLDGLVVREPTRNLVDRFLIPFQQSRDFALLDSLIHRVEGYAWYVLALEDLIDHGLVVFSPSPTTVKAFKNSAATVAENLAREIDASDSLIAPTDEAERGNAAVERYMSELKTEGIIYDFNAARQHLVRGMAAGLVVRYFDSHLLGATAINSYAGEYEQMKWLYKRPMEVSPEEEKWLGSRGERVDETKRAVATQTAVREVQAQLEIPRTVTLDTLPEYLHENRRNIAKFRKLARRYLERIKRADNVSDLDEMTKGLKDEIASKYRDLLVSQAERREARTRARDASHKTPEIATTFTLSLLTSHWFTRFELIWDVVHSVEVGFMASRIAQLALAEWRYRTNPTAILLES